MGLDLSRLQGLEATAEFDLGATGGSTQVGLVADDTVRSGSSATREGRFVVSESKLRRRDDDLGGSKVVKHLLGVAVNEIDVSKSHLCLSPTCLDTVSKTGCSETPWRDLRTGSHTRTRRQRSRHRCTLFVVSRCDRSGSDAMPSSHVLPGATRKWSAPFGDVRPRVHFFFVIHFVCLQSVWIAHQHLRHASLPSRLSHERWRLKSVPRTNSVNRTGVSAKTSSDHPLLSPVYPLHRRQHQAPPRQRHRIFARIRRQLHAILYKPPPARRPRHRHRRVPARGRLPPTRSTALSCARSTPP